MRYLIFHKPYGVLSTFTDPSDRPTLAGFIPVRGVYAAGRLDFKSEGLLLLTDDGDLVHRLTDPRYEHPKTYLAQVEGEITPEAVEQLRRGVNLGGLKTRRARESITETLRPLQAEIIPEPDLPPRPAPVRAYHPSSWLRIVLKEGKKHQVRRMTAAVGFPTLRLVRIAIGSLALGDLQLGEWRDLSPDEVARLMSKR